MSDYVCPCTIADEPCHPDCTCVKPHMSRGCLCCATYGSEEQRQAKANYLVKLCQRGSTMPIQHTKEFGIYHWDTFDNETFLKHEVDTLDEAVEYVEEEYKGRISPQGADQVDIVDSKGNIVRRFPVG